MPGFFNEGRLRKWLVAVVEEEGGRVGVLNYVFDDDEFLLTLNKAYLKHDDYTDVITFDYHQELGGISGDIFISMERVRENAKKYGIFFQEELCRVMVHGVLHLLGYGDKTESDRKVMEEKENYYLSLFV